jgi:release factor glutamine methyltransferase
MREAISPTAVERVSVADCRRAWTAKFRGRGIDSPELDARVLVGHALGLDHAALAAHADQPLSAEQQSAIAALARRRLAHEPVARITGTKEFWSLPLRVTDATLVPRPETETVVSAALDALDKRGPRSQPWRIADIGTGSGAIALALLSELPNAFAVGTDISAAALAIARDNARSLGLDRSLDGSLDRTFDMGPDMARAHYVQCDMASALSGAFDLIVSNPPYIATRDLDQLAPEVRLFDPRVALDGGADGLHWYRALAAAAALLLTPNGILAVELGKDQAEPVAALIAAAGLAPTAPHPDLNGTPRALIAVNVAGYDAQHCKVQMTGLGRSANKA